MKLIECQSCRQFPPSATGKGVDEPGLGGLLHDVRELLREDARRWVFAVDLPVRLCALTRLGDQHTEVGAHARIHDPDVRTNDGDLVYHGVVYEDGGGFLLCGDDDAIGSCKRAQQLETGRGNRTGNTPLIPRLVVPEDTAARACSICTSFPLGEKTVRE